MTIHLPKRLCGNPDLALQREWLVTNGLGGFAAGTVAGALTRRYHGLMVAALQPPTGRRLLFVKLDETVRRSASAAAEGGTPLYTNVWESGPEQPGACAVLERFDLRDGVPVWTYELGRHRLRKSLWMEWGANITYLRYEVATGAGPLSLSLRLLVNDRHYHHLIRGTPQMQAHAEGGLLEIRPPYAGVTLRARCISPAVRRNPWRMDYSLCRGFHLAVEAGRGFDHVEDHLAIAHCDVKVSADAPLMIVLSAGAPDSRISVLDDQSPPAAMQRRDARALQRLGDWSRSSGLATSKTPAAVQQLILAADQFLVARPGNAAAAAERGAAHVAAAHPTAHSAPGCTILAGYPWFTDWGRDTMIALPGLTLATGRSELARQILLTWANYVRDGLIPNRFPDHGSAPEYHTADGTLWYLWAIDQYVRASRDIDTLRRLYPVMRDIVDTHRRGTHHSIQMRPDGLVHAGEHDSSLTWMDARVGGRAVTPRIGKPVELSALWYDALCNLAWHARLLDEPEGEFARLAEQTRVSFQRFWNPDSHCCFDVIDGPEGHDAAVRPNQIFAVSLTHTPLPPPAQAAVVATCEQHLLAWFGLRSLSPRDSRYQGRYHGGPVERDGSYHQGTVWGWLAGPFALAHHRVHHDARAAQRLLEPLLGQVWGRGLGSISEIFDGDTPHAADGCPAQAWSVAETLRAWSVLAAAAAGGQRTAKSTGVGMGMGMGMGIVTV